MTNNTIENKLKELKKKSSVNPQLEDGYRVLENGVLTALIESDLTKYEYKIVLFIIDRSWGFKVKNTVLSLWDIEQTTKLNKRTIKTAIKNLEEKGIILVDKIENYTDVFEFAFMKYHDLWDKRISKKISKTNQENADKNVSSLDKNVSSLDKNVSSLDKNVFYTNIKYNNKKEIIKGNENFYFTYLSEWNKQNIKPQKEMNHTLSEKIKTALTFISEEQLTNAIQTYGEIVNSNLYWYTWKFTFSEFLNSGNMCAKTTQAKGYWQFLPEADPYNKFKYKNNTKTYFDDIRKTHPLPKIGVKASERLSGVSEGTYLGLDMDFVKNSPYERYELLFEGKNIEDITENYIIHLENIIVMLIYQKENEEFLKKCVDLHLKLLKKYDVKGEEL